jgi:microcompartment protein CcmL/EutN
VNEATAFIELGSWSAAMVILVGMEKAARVRIIQAELNDRPGVCLKIAGALPDVRAAVDTAEATGKGMAIAVMTDVIARPDPRSRAAYEAVQESSPILEQPVVHIPAPAPDSRYIDMPQQAEFAVGLIETQGFTAVFEAIDTAVKTADVEVLAREKLGGGYITVLIKGDVAAVTAAVEAGKAKVGELGRLIAAHVIASPSRAVLSLLPPK